MKYRGLLSGMLLSLVAVNIAVFLHFHRSPDPARPLRIGFGDDAPSHSRTPDGKPQGFAVDLLNEAAGRAGIQLEWVYAPERPDAALASGHVELWPLVGIVPKRQGKIYFSQAWMSMNFAVASRKDKPVDRRHQPSDLLLTVSPFNIERMVCARNFPNARVIEKPSHEDALGAVCSGEADAVLTSEPYDALQKRKECENVPLVVSSLQDGVVNFGIGASYASPQAMRAADALRHEMTKMAEEGTLQSIIFRWSYRNGAEIAAFFNFLDSRSKARRLTVAVCLLGIVLTVLVVLALRLTERTRALRREMVERERAEEQLVQSQKMEAIGRLAGGVAHDFNNILAIIMGQSELAQMLLDGKHPVRKRIEQITEAALRGSALTQQLLTYSRKQVLKTEILNINAVLTSMAALLHRVIGEDIDLQLRFRTDVGCIRSDRSRIEQILLNLAINSRDAMPNGGTLTLETENVELDQAGCRRYPDALPGRYVRFAVKDTGAGMTPEILSHLFEPFFTTKAKGKGTGLGLSTVYGVVKQNDGFISVQSELGMGTAVEILLPAVAEITAAPENSQAENQEPARARESETVLVVEDEEQLLKLAAEALETLGYKVLTASDGYRAIQVAESCEGKIDLLLTDVIMPGMGGGELAKAFRDICPSIPVLFMSGYTDGALGQYGVLDSDTFLLEKPFKTTELAARVRQMLDMHEAAVCSSLRGDSNNSFSSAHTPSAASTDPLNAQEVS